VGVEKGTKAVISANSSPPSTLEFAENRVIGEMAILRQLHPERSLPEDFADDGCKLFPSAVQYI